MNDTVSVVSAVGGMLTAAGGVLTAAGGVLTAAAQSDGVGGPGVALLVVGVVIGLALLAFCVAALVSIAGRPGLSTGQRAAWIVGVLIFQFFGPLVWFTVGRKSARRAGQRGS